MHLIFSFMMFKSTSGKKLRAYMFTFIPLINRSIFHVFYIKVNVVNYMHTNALYIYTDVFCIF